MGNTYEICWCEHKNNKAPIQKIDKDYYLITATGEVKQCKHIKNRYQSKAQLSQSFKRLRELINTNVTNINNCRWLTLTYREYMTDTKQAYLDFDKFMKRLRYRYGNIEYINVCEPQGNGRWHFHCLIILQQIQRLLLHVNISREISWIYNTKIILLMFHIVMVY